VANEIQKYTFSAVPTGGSWKPVYDSNPSSGSMNDVSVGNELAGYLGQIAGIDSSANVSCGGNYASGIMVEFVGALANTDMLTLSYQDNTLASAASDPSISIVQEGGVGQNEIQDITWSAGSGSFTLSWSGYGTTASINYNDASGAVSGILNGIFGAQTAVADISGGVRIEFISGLAETDMPTPTFSSSLANPVTISVSVLQEGAASSGSPQSPLNLLLLGVG